MQLTIIARSFAIALIFATMAGCKRNRELSDTLAWMDNTYNPHNEASHSVVGHGQLSSYSTRKGERYLLSRYTETFTYHGCQMTQHVKGDPNAEINSDMYIDSTTTFSLGDVNPQSIKVRFYPPEDSEGVCASVDTDPTNKTQCNAEIDFVTHSEAPLIKKESLTTFPKLQGSDHQFKASSKETQAYFFLDDSEYAGRFAKALRHAIELCGGKPEPF